MKKNRNKIIICLIGAVLLTALIGHFCANKTAAGVDNELDNNEFYFWAKEYADYMHYNDFMQILETGGVDDVYYCQSEEYMIFTMYNDETRKAKAAGESYQYTIADIRKTEYTAEENFRKTMLFYNVDLFLAVDDSVSSSTKLTLFVTGFLPVIMMGLLLIYWIRALNTGKVDKKDVLQKSDVTLDDIIGLDETKEELDIIVSLIKDTKEGNDVGAIVPHGILLSGPPGVGKTMIAKAISNAVDLPFISMSGSDFQELYVGNGAKHVRELFKLARENAPCIIFIDEFDAIGTSRESHTSNSEDRKTINALLKEMDGFKALDRVFVLAATNYSDQLDPAITRSGRFDREIIINPPRSWEDRLRLFNHYLKDRRLSEDVDLENLARTLTGFTGADIATVCNEAALVALGKRQNYIDDDCLTTALDKKIFKGSYSKSRVNEEDRRIVAYHESGHAVMSLILGESVSRASIKSTTSGVGGAVFNADSESQHIKKKDLQNRIKVCYAGRIAEELFFEDITAGAVNDIEKATSILKAYVGKYGFSEDIGLVNVYSIVGTKSNDVLLDEISKISKELEDEAYHLLESRKELIDKLAKKLLEVETMSGSEITKFLQISEIIETEEDSQSTIE